MSQSTTDPKDWRPAFADFVQNLRLRNEGVGVTGALIVSGNRFAEFLEGSEESIMVLREIITRDHRHGQVTCIEWAGGYECRQFDAWALAYWGEGNFFSQIFGGVQLGCDRQSPFVRDEIRTVFAEFGSHSAPRPVPGA